MFPPVSLPLPGEVILITDELLAPAYFLLHRFLSSHLKESNKSIAVLISVSEDIGRWKTIAGRSNLSLAAQVDSRNLVVIDAMSHITPALNSLSGNTLKALYEQVKSTLMEFHLNIEQTILVLLDGLSVVEWIGLSVEEIMRFCRVLCALCRQYNASLILGHHIVTPGEPDELLKRLLQLCTYHIDVFPLSSGRSGSVSGQIAFHAGSCTVEPTHRLVPRGSAIQYRLTDSGSTFFDRGIGNGVL